MNTAHTPVMRDEVTAALPDGLAVFVDATLGAGGHSLSILQKYQNCRIIGIDTDDSALYEAGQNLSAYSDRVTYMKGNFRDIGKLLAGYEPCGGILFDLGVSSMQIDRGVRGFSFNEDGPLDMRMDAASTGLTASDIVNTWDFAAIARIMREYGELPFAGILAKSIVERREKKEPFRTTEELVSLIRETLPAPMQRKGKGHPARRVFQALRIAVNDELGALENALAAVPSVCCGTAIFITYHSLEDRLVKQSYLNWQAKGLGAIVNKKPITPKEGEVISNRRSRSAKLRAFRFGAAFEKKIRNNKYAQFSKVIN